MESVLYVLATDAPEWSPGLPEWTRLAITGAIGLSALGIYWIIYRKNRQINNRNSRARDDLKSWTRKQPAGEHLSDLHVRCVRDGHEVEVELRAEYREKQESNFYRAYYTVKVGAGYPPLKVKAKLGPKTGSGPTGDPDFDRSFKISGGTTSDGLYLVTPEMRRMLLNSAGLMPTDKLTVLTVRDGRLCTVRNRWPLYNELEATVAEVVAAAASIKHATRPPRLL